MPYMYIRPRFKIPAVTEKPGGDRDLKQQDGFFGLANLNFSF